MKFNLFLKSEWVRIVIFEEKNVNSFINSSIFVESETTEHPFIPQILNNPMVMGPRKIKLLTQQNQKRYGRKPSQNYC